MILELSFIEPRSSPKTKNKKKLLLLVFFVRQGAVARFCTKDERACGDRVHPSYAKSSVVLRGFTAFFQRTAACRRVPVPRLLFCSQVRRSSGCRDFRGGGGQRVRQLFERKVPAHRRP